MAPLDWGLGHASRCVPLIERLASWGVEVWLGGSGRSLDFLRRRYPDLPSVPLPGYDIRYPRHSFLVPSLLAQLPRLWGVIRQEQAALRQHISRHGIKGVISDNRYGLHAPDLPSVILTHQLAPIASLRLLGASALSRRLHLRIMAGFSRIWVPDLPGPGSLGGLLSAGGEASPRVEYIGWLSRFAGMEAAPLPSPPPWVALISGPEPQRSLLEARVAAQAQALPPGGWIIGGRPEGRELPALGGPAVRYDFLDGPPLAAALRGAALVVSRPGYSSLMDFAALGLRRLLLVPTPGQTEQEYLAKKLLAQGRALVQPQKALDLPATFALPACEAAFPHGAQMDLFVPPLRAFLEEVSRCAGK